MSDNLTNKSNLKSFLIRTLLDPILLYSSLVVMTIMHQYRDRTSNIVAVTAFQKFWEKVTEYECALKYGLLAFAVGWVLFRFLDFVSSPRHKILSVLAFLGAAFGWLMLAGKVVDAGQEGYPIGWGLWFFTPQDSVTYNGYYNMGLFMMLGIFVMMVIYYFTRVRYRILMNFVIFLIPFLIYGKEYAKMPIGFIILMIISYLLIMVYFRSLNENDTVKLIDTPRLWMSVGVFAVIFAVVSTAVPKPIVEENRTYLESLMNAEAFTDKLVAMLSAFQDTADGQQFRGRMSNETVYFVQSKYPVHLKTSTFSFYDFETDKWSTGDIDSYYGTRDKDDFPVQFYMNQCVGDAILYAAELDSDFAERYGLTEYAGRSFRLPEPEPLHVWIWFPNTQTAPVPGFAQSLDSTTYSDPIDALRAGTIYTDEGSFEANTAFEYSYLPEGFIYSGDNRELLSAIEKAGDYQQLLDDAVQVLTDNNLDDNTQRLRTVVKNNSKYYNDYLTDLMDYGGDNDIRDLALEITKDCTTELEKAQELESYFYNNGFVYDLNYVKASGENVHDFLFNTKTGVCYEYATAMTLMSRAVGIPARFCEGYNAQTPFSEDTEVRDYWGARFTMPAVTKEGLRSFDVTGNDAHGYPELYIKGYGWVVFEPTVADTNADTKRSTTMSLSKTGFYLFIVAMAGFVLILLWPGLSNMFFIRINSKRDPEKAVRAAMQRVCRLYGIGRNFTSHEAAEKVMNTSGAQIEDIARIFDRTVYGNIAPDENDKQKIMEEYINAYNALREYKKQSRKEKKRNRKLKVKVN